MESEADGSTTISTYQLTCTDCEFETTVEGSVYDALDEAKSHREEFGQAYTEHFVDFEVASESE